MDIRAELKKLIGQQVAVDDQTMMTPKVIVGILTNSGDDTYSVEDQDEMSLFNWWEVAQLLGNRICLEGPLNPTENFTPDAGENDETVAHYDDDDDYYDYDYGDDYDGGYDGD